MSLSIKFSYAKGFFEQAFKDKYHPVARAATGAIKEAGTIALAEGRASIRAVGGNFGQRWPNALRFRAFPGGSRESANAAGIIFVRSKYFGVFEDGATIQGKPLLWIPLRGTPKNVGRKKMTPALYKALVGPLFLVKRPGKPPLLVARIRATDARAAKGLTLSQLRRGAAGKRGTIRSVPIFVGIPQARIPKLTRIRAAVEAAASRLPELYFKHFSDEG